MSDANQNAAQWVTGKDGIKAIRGSMIWIDSIYSDFNYDDKKRHGASVFLYLNFGNEGRHKIIAEQTFMEDSMDELKAKVNEWLNQKQEALIKLMIDGDFTTPSGAE